jgi:hypothetical protein
MIGKASLNEDICYSLWMACHESEIPTQSGHNFKGINIYGKAHLGDTYYYGKFVPDIVDRTLSGNLGLDSELNHLPYAANAPFDSYHRQHEPTCLDNTRVDLLKEIYNWADGQDK